MIREETGRQPISDTGRNRNQAARRRKIWTVIMTTALGIALGVGLFFGITALINNIYTTVYVPSVIGLDVKDAEELLSKEDINFKEVYFNSDEVKANIVFSQNPEEREIIRKGDTVILSVSSGPAQLTMPNVVDMNVDEATELLKRYGFTVTILPVISGDATVNTVVSQSPVANEKVTKDTPVSIYKSGGKTTVPLLKNLTLAEAEELLKQNDLRIGTTLTYVDTRSAKEHGKITGQTPAENLEVMLDSEVSLSIYRYPTDRADYSFEVTLNTAEADVALRITLQADESAVEFESFSHTYPTDMERKQPVTINLPDARHYTCRVYQNGEVTEEFGIGGQ